MAIDTGHKIGEIRKASEIGFKGHLKHIWVACLDCGKEHWVQLRRDRPNLRCRLCYGKSRVGLNASNWKGGRVTDGTGYILIKLYPDDFFYSMRCDKAGYVL